MLAKDSYGYNTFAGLRVAEVQQKTDIEDWKHISSSQNISDILTKGISPNKLRPESEWQRGPSWLIEPQENWPITTNSQSNQNNKEDIAKFLRKQKITTCVAKTFTSGIKKFELRGNHNYDEPLDKLICTVGDLERLVRYVARLLLWTRPGKSLRGETPKVERKIREITTSEYIDAYNFLIYWDQKQRLKESDIKRLVHTTVMVKLISFGKEVPHVVLVGRVKNFPQGFSTNQNIPILPYGVLAKLILVHYHNKYHNEVDTIVAHARRDVWIVKARKIASFIDIRCLICKLKRKKLASQIMEELPEFRSKMLPPFSVVCMDLFGPLEIRDDCVKRGPRIFKKVYGVVYSCTSTRAIYIDIAIDYSTEAVLHTVRRLMGHRGDVRMIISDPGSQLVGASQELSRWRKGWEMDKLIRFGATKGLEWQTIMPSSQHQNGAAEVIIKLVKGVKKSILHALGESVLSLNELNTLMVEIANLVNERPIGLKPNSVTDTEFLSPNSILLGRCSSRISAGPFQPDNIFTDNPKSVHTRFHLVQAIANQFWKVWQKIYFPSLLVRQKWHTGQRNLKVGDVCLIQDSSALRSEYRLARVTECYPDSKGRVRNVELMVKPKQGKSDKYIPSKPIYLKRHVNNLVVLVPADDEELQEVEGDGVELVDNNEENQKSS